MHEFGANQFRESGMTPCRWRILSCSLLQSAPQEGLGNCSLSQSNAICDFSLENWVKLNGCCCCIRTKVSDEWLLNASPQHVCTSTWVFRFHFSLMSGSLTDVLSSRRVFSGRQCAMWVAFCFCPTMIMWSIVNPPARYLLWGQQKNSCWFGLRRLSTCLSVRRLVDDINCSHACRTDRLHVRPTNQQLRRNERSSSKAADERTEEKSVQTLATRDCRQSVEVTVFHDGTLFEHQWMRRCQ